ncbi:hypothetical protein [Planktothricoides raciborskii]|uniref:Uncharacterized protein n=1 Tax=Planktothricoides raciborskii FACHB-1370 TaxID=2949576 RepID=A0ABR8EF39_9CYAN|nr:hypothetical protein [Planktothricoides raciborskii]MBD2545211.1 hypothetical protein [Planktothricoides raciborskii FACHB-1370]MBD2583260.1 hypothetical protein [Planktothricoides raciborskii FACHB-1261]
MQEQLGHSEAIIIDPIEPEPFAWDSASRNPLRESRLCNSAFRLDF